MGRGADFFNEFEEQRAQTIINFLQETEAKPADSGDYSCIAHNTEGIRTQNSLTVRVLGELKFWYCMAAQYYTVTRQNFLEPEGPGDSAFIRVSYPSIHRASHTDSKKFVLTAEKIQVQVRLW